MVEYGLFKIKQFKKEKLKILEKELKEMADKKLDFNDILKRGNDSYRQQRDKAPPSELYQCVLFYGRPVQEEVEEIKFIEDLSNFNTRNFIDRIRFGEMIEIAKTNWEAIKGQRFVFPLYSNEIFMSRNEAEAFFPIFIRRLIKEELLPQNVINEDTSMNEDLLQAAVVPLQITMLEQDRPEFKDS